MNKAFGFIGLIALVVCGMSHAAEVRYDPQRTLILDGMVKSVDWAGKTFSLVFHSNDGYEGNDWTINGPETAKLFKMGWKKEYLKAGDHLDAVIHPDQSGDLKGSLIRFYLNDGRTMEIGPHGTTRPVPLAVMNFRFKNPADDPMYGFYGNTQLYWASELNGPPGSNYNGHIWYNSDHTLLMFANDMQADGTWTQHQTEGRWWLQQERPGGKWTRCALFGNTAMPYCHSPVDFEKLGDSWQLLFHAYNANWTEHRALEAGQH